MFLSKSTLTEVFEVEFKTKVTLSLSLSNSDT